MELCSVLCGSLGGKGVYAYVWLSPFAFHLELSQHCLLISYCCCWSVAKLSLTLWPQGLACQALLPPLSPRACSNSCPFSWWWYLTAPSSAIPFSFSLQSFPESESFPVSRLFASGGQSTGVSASASVFPMNSRVDFFRSDWFDLLTLKTLL